jgi:hypothetical protein
METEQQDVRQALEGIEQAADKARRLELYKGADAIYMVWGVTWIIGFLVQHFAGHVCVQLGDYSAQVGGWAWNILVPIAIAVTLLIGRRRIPVHSPADKQLGVLWGLLFLYFALFFLLLLPLIDFQRFDTPQAQRGFLGAILLIPMFAYVVMGLFSHARYMLWLGLGITGANVFGVFAIPEWYYLWMALMGGGGLFAAGIVTRRAWRRA